MTCIQQTEPDSHLNILSEPDPSRQARVGYPTSSPDVKLRETVFEVAATKLWNSLLLDLRAVNSVEIKTEAQGPIFRLAFG